MKCWSNESMKKNNESTNGWINESLNHRMSESMKQWINESKNQRIKESKNQWVNESRNQGTCATSSSKSAPIPSVLCDFEAQIELHSRAHFADLIFQKCSDPISFLRFWSANRARYSLVHILLTSSSEVLRDREFFNVFKGKSSSRWHLSQIKPPNRRNRDPTSAAPGAKLPEKNTEFRARDHYNYPWIHTLPKCYTSQLLDDDGWLTWWCGWHDGVNANHDHRPWLRSFLTELPLIRRIESCASTRNTSLLASNRATSGPNSSPFSYQPLDFGGFSPCFARKPISRAQGH